MNHSQGALAGLIVGVIAAPLVYFFTFIPLFFLGMLTLANIDLCKQLYDGIQDFCKAAQLSPNAIAATITFFVMILVGHLRGWRIWSSSRPKSDDLSSPANSL